ncbi:MAG: type II toxin-antitoxin system YafQ family toxin [Synergistaceae bacterium]|nr:type II toxin-antitoxin system YafQ family toxin [Synergistaceae bacterium]
MLTPEPSTAFRNEIQRLARRGKDITKIFTPLLTLLNGQILPPQYMDHPLKGRWVGYRDFHIESDWIVVYRIVDNVLILARTGSHNDLFK